VCKDTNKGYVCTQNRFRLSVGTSTALAGNETRLASLETRLVLSRRVLGETRCMSRDSGNLLLSGTVWVLSGTFMLS